MKELSTEEKAKAYDEAYKKVAARFGSNVAKEIFPDLYESEDERIRKVLVEFFKSYKEQGTCGAETFNGIPTDNIIAWLEKQGKQSSDILHDVNEEPEEQREIFCEWDGSGAIWHDVAFYHADTKTFWNRGHRIKDVVKWAYVNEMLEKQTEQKPAKNIIETWKDMRLEVYQQASGNRHEPNYSDDTTKMFSLNDIDEIIEKMSEQKPTDKIEQKGMNIVEKDMTPFQKKVFCIIDTTIEEEQGLKQVCDELLSLAHDEIMQNPAWSEEDERCLTNAIDACKQMSDEDYDYSQSYIDAINWLKSLRPQNTWRPSDEQMIALQEAMNIVGILTITGSKINSLYQDLKKLRED